MIVVIDADPIVYRCGFAAEKPVWHVIYEDAEGPKEIAFEPDDNSTAGAKMKAWEKEHGDRISILDKSKRVAPEPLSHALRSTKVQVESIMQECEEQYKEGGKMLMFLSGRGGSFRDKIATVRPYKGNRDPSHKPYHYDSIRDYLQAQYGSFVTSHIEADDAVSILAHDHYERRKPERLVIATIDKDLDQIPGWHYNYMQKVHYAITNTEAERFFVYQILAGDATDNITGVWRCGDANANRLAAELRYTGRVTAYRQPIAQHGMVAAGTGAADPEQRGARCPSWWPHVVAEYAASQRKAGCPYAESSPEAVAIEMAQLVHLQQYPGQLWHPYGDLVTEGFGEGDFDVG